MAGLRKEMTDMGWAGSGIGFQRRLGSSGQRQDSFTSSCRGGTEEEQMGQWDIDKCQETESYLLLKTFSFLFPEIVTHLSRNISEPKLGR